MPPSASSPGSPGIHHHPSHSDAPFVRLRTDALHALLLATASPSSTGPWARWCTPSAWTSRASAETAFRDHHRDLKNCIDVLALTQGEAIRGIHAAYLEAGADIVETNTFGATSVALADFGLQHHTRELNLAAARLAREAADAADGQDARPAPVRRRLDRPDQQAAVDRRQRRRPGPSRRDVRRDGGGVPRADRGAHRGRRRSPARRDGLRHARAQEPACTPSSRCSPTSAARCR